MCFAYVSHRGLTYDFTCAAHVLLTYASHTHHMRSPEVNVYVSYAFYNVLHMFCMRGHLGYVYVPPRQAPDGSPGGFWDSLIFLIYPINISLKSILLVQVTPPLFCIYSPGPVSLLTGRPLIGLSHKDAWFFPAHHTQLVVERWWLLMYIYIFYPCIEGLDNWYNWYSLI